MRCLDVQEQRWYCDSDDEIFLAAENRWDESVSVEAEMSVGDRRSSRRRSNAMWCGAFVGCIYGVVQFANYYLHLSMSPILLDSQRLLIGAVGTVLLVPLLAVVGAILGAVFLRFEERIPSKSTLGKSLVFSLILMALLIIPRLGPLTLYIALHSAGLWYLALFLVEYLLLGCLFAYMLNRKREGTR